jgi:hypothetical protein
MASSNTLITPTIIAKEALMMLLNNMVMGANVHRQYKNEFAKVGQTITIRKPNKFRATKAQARSNSNITEPSTSLTVATQAHVSWAFSSVELTQTVEDYSKRYIQPAAAALANQIDYDLCGLYADVYNSVGTPGTTPGTFRVLADAAQRLDEEGAPQDRRVGVFNPAGHWALADGLKGTFAPTVAKDIITRGFLGKIGNVDLYMDQNIRTHTTGAFTTGATPLVDGAQGATATATLNCNGWNAGASTLLKGDVFTIDGVYAVNPMSGASTGSLRQFVVTTNTTSAAGAMATLPISPTLLSASGAYQTVSAAAGNDEEIVPLGTESTGYPQNLVFHPNAFALVTLPIEMPANVWGARETFNGISIRVVKQYDIDADEEIVRLDVLYGVKCLYPELGCRVWG